jgi:putative transport protein
MEAITQYAQSNIVLLLFLIVGLGNLVGKLKIGSIALGPTTGILVVGILIGLLHFDVPPIVKAIFFTLYLFALGTKIGPGFVNVLTSKASIKYLVMCLSTVVLMAVSIFFVAKFFDLDSVVVGGLSAGAMTTSAILAASQGFISSGNITLPDGMSASDASNMLASSYAITYLYGTFGLIILVKIAPMLVGKDVAVEAAKLDAGGGGELDLGNRGGSIRAFRVTKDDYIGKTVADMEAGAAKREADKGLPTLIEKVIRDGELLEVTPDLVLQSGDVVAVWATPGILVFGTELLGEEVTDPNALRVSLTSAEVVVTSKDLEGMSLRDLVREHGRGVTIERMARNGEDQPIRGDLTLIRGDVFFVSGPTRQVELFEQTVGYVVTDQLATDLVNLGIFLAVFGALGTITVTVMGITLSVLGGASIGAMLGGAILGWLRSRSPKMGTIAAPAADAIANIGLGLFISAVAIGAGGSIVSVIQTLGPKLIIAGVIVTTVCTLGTFLFGHFVMRLNVAENAGTTCGCMTGVAIGEVMKDAKSSVPAIGYALPSALQNVLFIAVALVLMSIL